MPSSIQKSLFHGTTYAEADKFLTVRGTDEIKIANNTTLRRIPGGSIAVRLHWTDVVTYFPNTDTVRLNSGGYHTPTTARRMSQFSPHSVSLRPVKPSMVAPYGNWDNAISFTDGMMVGDTCACGESDVYDGYAQCPMHPEA